tara:strand:- start:1572 stop:1877 length:306 start_codon:yes stop_codon:yes gene_type:complete
MEKEEIEKHFELVGRLEDKITMLEGKLEKGCVKCKLRLLTKGKQSSFAKETLLLEARKFMIDDGYNLDAVQSFDSSKINGGFSVTELMVEFYQYLTKNQPK